MNFQNSGQIPITCQPSYRIDYTLTIDTSSTLYKTWILAHQSVKFQTLLNVTCLQFHNMLP